MESALIILSKFHDFYDHGMSFGYDPNDIRYVREKLEITEADARKLFPIDSEIDRAPQGQIYSTRRCGKFSLQPIMIVFCGKIYRCVKVADQTTGYDQTACFYHTLDLSNYIKTRYRFEFQKHAGWDWLHDDRPRYLKFLDDQGDGSKNFYDRCIANRIIVAVRTLPANYGPDIWELNRQLKDLEFYRIMSPYQAYQELSMWIGGVLIQPDKPMVTVSDAMKIHKAGYDKWSFRKMA